MLSVCTMWCPVCEDVKIIFCERPSLVPDLSDVGDEVWGEVGVEVVEGR